MANKKGGPWGPPFVHPVTSHAHDAGYIRSNTTDSDGTALHSRTLRNREPSKIRGSCISLYFVTVILNEVVAGINTFPPGGTGGGVAPQHRTSTALI